MNNKHANKKYALEFASHTNWIDIRSIDVTTLVVSQVKVVLFMDAKRDQGIHGIHRAIEKGVLHNNKLRLNGG